MEEVVATLNLSKRQIYNVKLVMTNVNFCHFTETREMCCPPMLEATVTSSTQDYRNKIGQKYVPLHLRFITHNREYCSYLVPEKEIRLTKLKLLYV